MRSATVVQAGSEVTAELAAVLARFTAAAAPEGTDDAGDADRVDQIALLEQIKAAAVAAQQTLMVRFARSQVEAQITQIADGTLDPAKVGRGIGDQIGLACRVSPVTGSRRLETARVLHADLSWYPRPAGRRGDQRRHRRVGGHRNPPSEPRAAPAG
jgi:hypothetical protein